MAEDAKDDDLLNVIRTLGLAVERIEARIGVDQGPSTHGSAIEETKSGNLRFKEGTKLWEILTICKQRPIHRIKSMCKWKGRRRRMVSHSSSQIVPGSSDDSLTQKPL
jgi:hypothetical protein